MREGAAADSGKAGGDRGRQQSQVWGGGGVGQGSAEKSGMEWQRILAGVSNGAGDVDAAD